MELINASKTTVRISYLKFGSNEISMSQILIHGLLPGHKVKADNDPKCMSFMEVGQCVHDVFFDVRQTLIYSNPF